MPMFRALVPIEIEADSIEEAEHLLEEISSLVADEAGGAGKIIVIETDVDFEEQ